MEESTFKYDENISLAKIQKYIESTYEQHYVGNNDVQTIDVWESLGIAKSVCRGTAIKYLMRLGRKDGYNEKDMLKAVHYIILLMHFNNEEQQ